MTMKEEFTLKEIKRQVYLFYSEDGLVDLAVGALLLGFGLLLRARFPALVGLLGLVPLSIWYIGKQLLVIPRVGTIQLGGEMKRRFRGQLVYLLVLGIGFFTLLLLGGGRVLVYFSSHSLALFGLILGLGIASLGLLLRASRFYLYGLLVFGALAVGEYLNESITAVDPFLTAVMAAGGLILGAGLVILARFLSKYPVISEEGRA
jgi:hypothetical protein